MRRGEGREGKGREVEWRRRPDILHIFYILYKLNVNYILFNLRVLTNNLRVLNWYATKIKPGPQGDRGERCIMKNIIMKILFKVLKLFGYGYCPELGEIMKTNFKPTPGIVVDDDINDIIDIMY